MQLGSWVPAASCVLSVFDGVYTRMGASDCLKLGRSTFAEELGEASHILARATSRWGLAGEAAVAHAMLVNPVHLPCQLIGTSNLLDTQVAIGVVDSSLVNNMHFVALTRDALVWYF